MADLNGKRIFIVEDDVMNMAVYAITLKQHGASVIQDPWNANTLNMIKQFMPIDIVLLDLMLKGDVSGYDIHAKIRAENDFADIPVLAVSASDPTVEIPKTKEQGFNGFISKPINVRLFPEQVLACIHGEKIWYDEQ